MASGTIKNFANDSGTGYCKMPDGTLIQWGRITVSDVPITNTWGALYESPAQSSGVVFPIPFIDTPCVVATAKLGPAAWLEYITSDREGLGTFYLVRPTSVTATNGHIHWQAVGRWK